MMERVLLRGVVVDSRFQAIDIACEDVGFKRVSGAAGRGGLEGQAAGFGLDLADEPESRKETVRELCQRDRPFCCVPARSAALKTADLARFRRDLAADLAFRG